MARVALLFSGLPRQWEHCITSQMGLFKSNQADVFFHFWDTVDDAEKARLVEAYRPKAWKFEKQIDFSAVEKDLREIDNINSPTRLMSQYYSWKSVAEIFNEYRKTSGIIYDFAVRLRADLMFFDALDEALPRLLPTDMVLSEHNNFNLVNDMFAVGGVEPILYYHTLFDHAQAYNQAGQIFNPELLLIHHLNTNKIGIRVMMSKMIILVFRQHMAGMSIEECLKEHPGQSKWKDPEIVKGHMEFHERRLGQKGIEYVEWFKDYHLREMEQKKKPVFFYNKPGPVFFYKNST